MNGQITKNEVLERAIRNAKKAENYAQGVEGFAAVAEAWARIGAAMESDTRLIGNL